MAIKNIIRIGRSVESNYCINSDSVSNRHAWIVESTDYKYLLIDCGSMNGTRLVDNGDAVKITQTEINRESIILFGEEQVSLRTILSNQTPKNKQKQEKQDFTRIRDPLDGTIKERPR